MERRYLTDEREPQAESAFAAAGFVRAVESAPYLRQILFFYPDSVVLHREHDAVVFLEPDFNVPAVSAVFDGVREQIFEHQRDQLRLRGNHNIVFDVRSERDVLCGYKIGACFFDELTQVSVLELVALVALLGARERQQSRDELRHLVRLLVYRRERLEHIFFARVVGQRVFAFRLYHGERRAQLVRGVGGELLFVFERGLEPCEHVVEGLGKRVYFARALLHLYAL